ncbi:MAG: 50S ribosomal protein L30 [Candidatus Nanoarchaeia archaeon]|nr:50S ribosomal protein L30 [Candidatus Nanoarchaeia archaeon]
MYKRIAIVRVRSSVETRKDVNDTMKMLRLYKTNTCVIVKNTPEVNGMIAKVKDYVTWGEIDTQTMKELLLKRGRLAANKPVTDNYIKEKTKISADEFVNNFMDLRKDLREIPGLKTFFRLNPPQKGFERAGIKKTFVQGGVLGYRKEKINDLILRML